MRSNYNYDKSSTVVAHFLHLECTLVWQGVTLMINFVPARTSYIKATH